MSTVFVNPNKLCNNNPKTPFEQFSLLYKSEEIQLNTSILQVCKVVNTQDIGL